MVACDNDECVHEWFHYECVGLTEAPSPDQECAQLMHYVTMSPEAIPCFLYEHGVGACNRGGLCRGGSTRGKAIGEAEPVGGEQARGGCTESVEAH
eukprot:1158965-Pelagomonas_calceolata.AAC.1